MTGQEVLGLGGFTLHDRCSRELASGFRKLRFSRQLEEEYRSHLRTDQLPSTLLCMKLGLAVWLIFAVLDIHRLGLLGPSPRLQSQFWLLLTIRWAVALVFVIGIASAARLSGRLGQLAFVVYSSLGVGSALTAQIYKVNGIPQGEVAQLIVLMVAFMPIGLTFYQALAAATLIAVTTMITGFLFHAPDNMIGHLYMSLMLMLAIPVGATGGYLREHADREQFLLRGVLERYAFYDPLTSLANRRLFEQHIATALSHAARQKEPVVFAIVDVDFFKQYNDFYGHAAGDIALRRVASALNECVQRPMDMAARVGGEEFALLLYGTDLASAETVIATLRDKVAALAIPHERSSVSQHLTVSAGVTRHNGAEAVEGMLHRADLLLYQSKQNGRDRATFA